MIRLAFAVADARGMYGSGFAVMVNGGAYQDVPQAHLHLAGHDQGLLYPAPTSRLERTLLDEAGLVAFEHPEPRRQIHVAIVPSEHLAWRDLSGEVSVRFASALVGVAQRLVARYGLASAGYTLLASIGPDGARDPVCFHLVGGGRREPVGARSATPEPGPTTPEPVRPPQRPD